LTHLPRKDFHEIYAGEAQLPGKFGSMDTTDDIDEGLLAHSKEELLSIANN
jgi:hypothetical protein